MSILFKIGVLLFLFIRPCFAEERNHQFYVLGDNVYYSCSAVKQSAKAWLNKLGAKDVNIRCSGGLPSLIPPKVQLSFDSPTIYDFDAEWRFLEIASRNSQSCELEKQIFEEVVPYFEVPSLEIKDNCRSARGRVQVDIVLLAWPKSH